MCVHLHSSANLSSCFCIYTHLHTCVHIYINVCIHVFLSVSLPIHLYSFILTCLHIQTWLIPCNQRGQGSMERWQGLTSWSTSGAVQGSVDKFNANSAENCVRQEEVVLNGTASWMGIQLWPQMQSGCEVWMSSLGGAGTLKRRPA